MVEKLPMHNMGTPTRQCLVGVPMLCMGSAGTTPRQILDRPPHAIFRTLIVYHSREILGPSFISLFNFLSFIFSFSVFY
jgi:hypothetical protein